MSSRLVFDSWQLSLPAIGFLIFVAAFAWVVFRVIRMNRNSRRHLENLPLENEFPRPASHVRSDQHQS